jgi:prolyl oligopeptidase
VLLRTNPSAGHGRGTPLSDQIDEYTDVLAFLMRELGLEK